MGTTTEKLNKLIQTKVAIKAALIEKGQNPSDVFSTYAADIKAIKDIPILDGTALPNNVLKDKTFYNTNPNSKLTGTIETFNPQDEYTSNQTLETSGKYLSGDIIINTPVKKDEQTKTVELNMSTGNQVITPDPNKVLTEVTINKPNTFTESNIRADISIGGITGTFTSDADAVASDIIEGKTAYVNGEKIIGTIETFTPSEVTSNGTLQTNGKYVNGDIVVNVPAPTLDGNATADNVLKGKTFYSNSTTKQTGTMPNNGQEHGIINNTEHPKYNIAKGYHDGTGYVEINASQIVDCVAENILQGKTILQVQGTLIKGITPSGKKTITSTAETDVTNFATAQVVDSNLVASNIKKNVSILGITGTLEEGITPTGTLDITTNGTKDVTNYASVNVNVPLPTLNAPTISLSDSTVTITNPATNGSFVSGYDVYKTGTLLTSITLANVDLSTLITDSGTYTITVKAKGTNFNDSVASNSIEYTVLPSGGFVQVYPQKDGNYTTLSNMNSSKIYGVKDYGYFQYNNGSWESSYYEFDITSQSATSITFRDTSGGNTAFNYWSNIIVVEGDSIPEDSDYSGMTGTQVLAKWICFVEGTLITMADGTQKKIEDITYDDKVLTYDFDKSEFTQGDIFWIAKENVATEYWKIILNDGTELKLVGSNGKSHRLFSVDNNKFLYPQDFTGKVFKENKEMPTIVSCEKINEKVKYYNFLNTHLNCFANGVMAGCRFSNIYPIENMKYVKNKIRNNSLESFEDIPQKYIDGLRLKEQPLEKDESNVNYYDTVKDHIINVYMRLEKNDKK